MDRWESGRMGGWMGGRIDKWMGGWAGGWAGGWMVDGWAGGYSDRQADSLWFPPVNVTLFYCLKVKLNHNENWKWRFKRCCLHPTPSNIASNLFSDARLS